MTTLGNFITRLSTDLRTRFVVFLLLTPGFWWLLFQPALVWQQWQQIPQLTLMNLTHPRTEFINSVNDLRWGGPTIGRNNLLAKVYYNRLAIFPKEIFEYLQFLTPRIYFLSGDGSNFTPSRLGPLSSLLFPFWIFGLVILLKRRQLLPLFLVAGFALLSYLPGRKNFALLFPVMLLYLFISLVGIDIISSPRLKKIVLILLVIYGLYITEMALWLRPLPV